MSNVSKRYKLEDGRTVTVTWSHKIPFLVETFDGDQAVPQETLTTQVKKAAEKGFEQAQPPAGE